MVFSCDEQRRMRRVVYARFAIVIDVETDVSPNIVNVARFVSLSQAIRDGRTTLHRPVCRRIVAAKKGAVDGDVIYVPTPIDVKLLTGTSVVLSMHEYLVC